jgi:hypothetical protein
LIKFHVLFCFVTYLSGPGDYNGTRSYFAEVGERSRALARSLSSTHARARSRSESRLDFAVPESPGPGAYGETTGGTLALSKSLSGSVSSGTPRATALPFGTSQRFLSADNGVPGPGDYLADVPPPPPRSTSKSSPRLAFSREE